VGLTEYRRKRDFERTSEPKGRKASRRRSGLSFVIQKHAATRLHYDFRLELDGVLKSWAVPKGPSVNPADKRLAVEVEDHPLEYGGFEGTIPKHEYGGGSVLLWDRGRWTPDGDAREGLRKGSLSFELEGEKLHGRWKLVRMGGRATERAAKPQWLLIKERDEHARGGKDSDILEERPESVDSGRTIDEIGERAKQGAGRKWTRAAGEKPKTRRARGKSLDPSELPGARRAKLPDVIAPQLATLVDTPPQGDDWIHEIKYDGYRLLCRIAAGKATLLTRSGQDWTDRFESIAEAAAALPVEDAMIDGEAVVLGADGRSSFQALQNAIGRSGFPSIQYFAFDLLHLDHHDLTRVPLERRKEALAALLGPRDGSDTLRYSDHVLGKGAPFYAAACRRKLEGIVAKRREGPYRSGRGRDWVKVKCTARREFVIGGYTEPRGARSAFGALLIGVHENGDGLRYAGRVGTGFTQASLRELHEKLARLETAKPPFRDPPPARDVHWVKPRLVAEVEFTEMTKDGLLRHPSFQGLREDKPASEVVDEAPVEPLPDPGSGTKRRPSKRPMTQANTIAGVTLTHPDRVLYPEIELTKLGLAQYMASVASRMIPEIADRPLMLKRCPEGTSGACFFQKHPGATSHAALGQVRIREKAGVATYLTVRDEEGLVALVQMGVLEVHVWGARADDVEKPDRIVFDLDPDPDVAWKAVVETARELNQRLTALDLVAFLKTTGGKGLHIVVPIRRGPEWDDVKQFSSAIAALLVREHPDLLTTHMSKARRHGRILIDTLRNRRGATWVAPYSPRARERAPVSTPLAWSELTTGVGPDQFTVENLARRLAGLKRDPWAAIASTKQTLTAKVLGKLSGSDGAVPAKRARSR